MKRDLGLSRIKRKDKRKQVGLNITCFFGREKWAMLDGDNKEIVFGKNKTKK